MTETWWVEVDAHGRILQKTGGDEPRAMFGGTVHEVDSRPDPTRQMYVDGALLDLGERPSWHHQIDPVARAWVVPGSTELQVAQDAKWTQIKADRAAARSAPLVTPYGTFDADDAARTNITDTILLLQTLRAKGLPAETEFTLADDSEIVVTAEQMEHVGILLGEQVQGAFSTGRALRAAIYAEDATLSSVAAVAWPTAPPLH